jgi:hypothetical protein
MFEITNILLFYCNVNLPIASCEAYVFFLKTMKVIFFGALERSENIHLND